MRSSRRVDDVGDGEVLELAMEREEVGEMRLLSHVVLSQCLVIRYLNTE